ncbi:hypothetical protein BDV37DRAFT_248538 [Aspergillus pseudonomiae]|uniref:Uncharacterized protein n=1 Tax=Aspergillus pseudonomiae TaxID=1506151 RepID=A0A5N7DCM4_9EURO|nr:uncharacterized protein BDV37DRAFT_248538 [Aspergillus pseudonomiae]KAE8403989.1 hypothetical protein BDV37DRAFT_248538 [Aspergillus pseudonomiae]
MKQIRSRSTMRYRMSLYLQQKFARKLYNSSKQSTSSPQFPEKTSSITLPSNFSNSSTYLSGSNIRDASNLHQKQQYTSIRYT